MNTIKSKIKYVLGVIVLVLGLLGGYGTISQQDEPQVFQNTESLTMAEDKTENIETASSVTEDGIYTGKEEVAEYIYLFGHLPENFITKK